MSVAEKVLDAIELLTNNSVAKAGYDRTIQAQILSCEDETTGKYRCRHQDAVFYAYSTNIDVSYSKGTSVYILVPANDMSKDKTILGSVDQMGINYLSEGGGDPYFYNIGGNCISQSEDFLYLNSGIKRYLYTLYDAENSNNVINFDSDALNVYIKQTNYLKLGMKVQTRIPQQNRYQGSYGIIYELQFDNGQTGTSTNTYMLSSNDVQGEPFNLPNSTEVFNYFPINGQNFKRIKSVHIFNQDFYNSTQEGHPDPQTEELDSGDIIFSDLLFQAVGMLTPEQLQGTLMNISTRAVSASTTTLIAEVFSNGNKVESNLFYYWGKRNITITPDSPEYNELLGRGWQCLNTYNTVGNTGLREWRPESNEFTINLNTLGSRSTMFKAAAAYNNNIISDQEEVINPNAIEIKIITEDRDGNNKTTFYNEGDSVVLTCSVNGKTDLQELNEYTFKWAREINNNTLALLEETTEKNTAFDNKVSQLKVLQQGRNDGSISKKASEETYSQLSQQIYRETFENFMVNKNKVYGVQAYSFEDICTYYCAVSKNGQYIGTAQISLFKKVGEIAEGAYTLVIDNGTVAFQYDEQGRAPTRDMVNPQTIQALGFTLYNAEGTAISANTIINSRNGKVVWQIPTTNTLLIDKQNPKSDKQQGGYRAYQNLENFLYDIAYSYNVNSVNNQIKLSVTYDGLTLNAQTNFVFTKQGNPGTNGTEYVVSITPALPIITQVGNDTSNFYWNDEQKPFDTDIRSLLTAKLYNGAEEIDITDNTKYSITWTILSNKYTSSKYDDSAFVIGNNGKITYSGNDFSGTKITQAYANILKCTITDISDITNKRSYYSTVPIITAWVASDDYRINLKENTGCRFVVYNTDGTRPQYNKTPFTIVYSKKMTYDGITVWQDELIKAEDQVTYTFGAVGNYKDTSSIDTTPTPANLLTVIARKENDGLLDNQCNYKIAQTYDGLCVNAAATCIVKDTSQIEICKINIPVHFLLNKYGFANLNDWDGNSIQINNNGGYILSPQMGAGEKDENNAFTGVLMGHVEYDNKKRNGLLGLSEGAETFFVNSENGSVILGKNNGGQIIIDPSVENKALLYSHSYWRNWGNNGLPSSYGTSNLAYQGMLIDLSEPKIHFGDATGKLYSGQHNTLGSVKEGFYLSHNGLSIGSQTYVDENGVLRLGKGAVTGGSNSKYWTINGATDGSYSYIKYGNTDFASSDLGTVNQRIGGSDGQVYLGTDGVRLGKKFAVDNNGNFSATNANITGSITASSLTLQSGATVSGLSYNSLNDKPDLTIYVAKDGTIGSTPAADATGFVVSSQGLLQASNAIIYGKIYTGQGTIAGWNINTNNITGGSTTLNKNGSIYTNNQSDFNGTGNGVHISSSGIRLGNAFKVSSTGAVVMNDGHLDLSADSTTGEYTYIKLSSGSASNPRLSHMTPGSLLIRNPETETNIEGGDISAETLSVAKINGSPPVTGVKGDGESSYRTGNVNITKANLGLGNVENKSSATIRSEITKANVTSALGITTVTTSAQVSVGINSSAGGSWSVSGTVLGLVGFNTDNKEVYVATINTNGVVLSNKDMYEAHTVTCTATWAVIP